MKHWEESQCFIKNIVSSGLCWQGQHFKDSFFSLLYKQFMLSISGNTLNCLSGAKSQNCSSVVDLKIFLIKSWSSIPSIRPPLK